MMIACVWGCLGAYTCLHNVWLGRSVYVWVAGVCVGGLCVCVNVCVYTHLGQI